MSVAMFIYVILLLGFELSFTVSVPPEACFAPFRWDDCGGLPTPVVYYWKPGSRCEVGTWRGCLPNPNMFGDEYECVQTCIFAMRAQPPDFHDVENELLSNEMASQPTKSTSRGTTENATKNITRNITKGTTRNVTKNTTTNNATKNTTNATDGTTKTTRWFSIPQTMSSFW